MKYMCYAPETCPTTGRAHWQCYVYFKAPILIKTAAARCGCGVEVCNGSAEENRSYIKGPYEKDGKVKPENPEFKEFGILPEQGKRKDIDAIVSSIRDGATNTELLETHGDQVLRMYHAIDWAREALDMRERNWIMDVRIYWGPPGTGKTRAVWDEFRTQGVYAKMVDNKWWDGYKGEHCVVFDDFDVRNCEGFDYYLKLLDRYPMRVEYKGGSCQFRSRVIIFTSNFDPDIWWADRANRAAFFRRVTEVRHFV